MTYIRENVLQKALKNGINFNSNIFRDIHEKCGNKVFSKSFMTYNNYLKNTSPCHKAAFISANINTNNLLFQKNLIKYFSTSPIQKDKINKNDISSDYSKNNLSILQNPNVLVLFDKNAPETIGQKIYRYLDITGFLTRYNNRKEWILDLDPYTRLSTVMLTEYERKLIIFLKFHVYLLFVICMYLWYHAQVHFTMKPPCPKPYAYGHLDGRKRDFTWHGKLFFIYPKTRCKECRWLDIQCKKECFDKLKQEGHKFFINNGDPLSVPKTVLYPPHFH
ncbi:conserved Plasmodium protein, unknown function [Plasmodium vinckei]|uniref:Uncharacterized protein n=1 Tax=Plasmodium vinckei TaxID=5860 RepID=A0A6V7TB92_PLAVN|nr:conserved Plasmodium protein, unknown function [Plasmodium vinckei]